MKIKLVPTIITAAISALLAFGLYSLCKSQGQETLLAVGGFVSFLITLGVCLAVRFEGRTSASTVALGVVFFILMFVSHAIFAFVHFTTTPYVVINGVLLLAFMGIVYGVAKTKQ